MKWLPRAWWFWLGSVAGLATVLRLPLLNSSFWLDEAAQAIESTRPWYQQLELAADFQPPLFHLWTYVVSFAGTSEAVLRLASLVPAILGIVVCMMAVKNEFSKRTAVLTGLLLATSNIHLYFSQELRPYMLAVFWAMLFWWAWGRFFAVRERKYWWLATISLALGWLTVYTFVFFFIGFLVSEVIWHRERILLSFRMLLVSGIWWLIWWPQFLEQWQVGQRLRWQLPGWDVIVSPPFLKVLPLTLVKFVTGVIPLDPTFLVLTLGTLSFAVLSVAAWKNRWLLVDEVSSRPVGKLLFLVGAAFLVAWVFSIFTPVMAPKRLLFLLPFCLVILAEISLQMRRWGKAVLAVYFVWQLVATVGYWTEPSWQREHWREAVQEIESRFQAESTVLVFAFDAPFAPWRWYAREKFAVITTGLEPLQEATTTSEKLESVASYDTVLVFSYLQDLTDPYDMVETAVEEHGFDTTGLVDQSGVGFVRVFTKRDLFALRNL